MLVLLPASRYDLLMEPKLIQGDCLLVMRELPADMTTAGMTRMLPTRVNLLQI